MADAHPRTLARRHRRCAPLRPLPRRYRALALDTEFLPVERHRLHDVRTVERIDKDHSLQGSIRPFAQTP